MLLWQQRPGWAHHSIGANLVVDSSSSCAHCHRPTPRSYGHKEQWNILCDGGLQWDTSVKHSHQSCGCCQQQALLAEARAAKQPESCVSAVLFSVFGLVSCLPPLLIYRRLLHFALSDLQLSNFCWMLWKSLKPGQTIYQLLQENEPAL